MGLQDGAFLPSQNSFSTTFLRNCGRGENLETTTCLKTVVDVSKGMFLVKYFCSSKDSFLCPSNSMEIIRLSQR